MRKAFSKYIPFCKVDAAKREVWGIITAEVEDKTGETCHYETTVPQYKALFDEMSQATDGRNICPLREMHQLSAVGKGIGFEFRDDSREIFMGFKVVDDDAWVKVDEGVYTGFSHGGHADYFTKDQKPWYTAYPSEVSLVDNPCLGVCHFAYVKADGAVEMRKVRDYELPRREGEMDVETIRSLAKKLDAILEKEAKTKRVAGEDLSSSAFAYVGDPDDTSTWKLPIKFSSEEKTKSHIRNALARFNQTQGIPASEKAKVKAKIVAAAKKHGIDVSEDKIASVDSLLQKATELSRLDKSLYSISDMVGIINSLRYVLSDCEWEALYEDGEGDPKDEELATKIGALLESAIQVLKDLVEEETSELTAKAVNTHKGEVMTAKQKAASFEKMAAREKSLAELYAKTAKGFEAMAAATKDLDVAKVHKAQAENYEELSKNHAAQAEEFIKTGAECEDDDMDGDGKKKKKADDEGEKAMNADEIRKMVAETVAEEIGKALAKAAPAAAAASAANAAAAGAGGGTDDKGLAAGGTTALGLFDLNKASPELQKEAVGMWENAVREMIKTRCDQMKTSPEAQKAIFEQFGFKLEPTIVKVAGGQLVDRQGNNLSYDAPNQDDVGL